MRYDGANAEWPHTSPNMVCGEWEPKSENHITGGLDEPDNTDWIAEVNMSWHVVSRMVDSIESTRQKYCTCDEDDGDPCLACAMALDIDSDAVEVRKKWKSSGAMDLGHLLISEFGFGGSSDGTIHEFARKLILEQREQIRGMISDLEREREAHYHAIGRANGFEFRTNEKFAMRKEFEELLGVEHGAAGDEQFQKGMDAIRALLSDRRRLRKVEHLAKLGYHLSMYAADIQWDGCRNRDAWLDGLREAIVKLQQQYRDTFGED